MKRISKQFPFTLLSMLVAVVLLCPHVLWAKRDSLDIWQTQETLTNRLSMEWFKIGFLKDNIENVEDILNDLRNLQLYPSGVTQLSDNAIVSIDRKIEAQEKELSAITEELDKLIAPLSDAIAILKEMATGEPVVDMFDVITQGDMERISEMIALKHRLDIVWTTLDQLMTSINSYMKLPPFVADSTYGIDREFFIILKANLGLRSEEYYDKLNHIKNALVKRANSTEVAILYKIELNQIKGYLNSGKEAFAKHKISMMKERYTDKKYAHEIDIYLVRINFLIKDYFSSLHIIHHLPEDPFFEQEKILFKVQCWYALEAFETLWNWGIEYDFSKFSGEDKNLLLWMTMESAFTLNITKDLSTYAEQMDAFSPYAIHVLHALARSYINNYQFEVALSVFEKALEHKPLGEIDQVAHDRILLDYAKTLFEMKRYREALDQFFKLLNNEKYFEESLFGIAWCYLKLEMYQKASTTLRKLINQSPQSYRAAEAIQILSMRLISKAHYEWQKVTYLSKEEKKLVTVLEKLSKKITTSTQSSKISEYKSVYKEMQEILSQLTQEPRKDYPALYSLYDEALSICDLIAAYYETGSFQELRFSDKREKILHQLDSLIITIGSSKKGNKFTQRFTKENRLDIQKIKSIVDKSYVRSAEILLDLYRWQDNYMDWAKKMSIDTLRSLKKSSLVAQSNTDRIQRINKRIDSLVIESKQLDKNWYGKLSTILTDLMQTPLEPADEIYLRYHLGELSYWQENRTFNRDFDVYERKITLYDSLISLYNDGKLLEMPDAPAPPQLRHTKSMHQYRTAIEKYPKTKDIFIAANRYSLAWCYNDLGHFDSAVSQMTEVAHNFKHSPFAPQAWMYLGEHYFDIGNLDSAIYAYRAVMKYPESEWFDDALYKLAWTQYRNSNPEKAISSFLAVVDLGKDKKAGKALLEKESIDYIAISFSETDSLTDKGLKRAAIFCKKLGDPPKGMQILHRLGDIYAKQGRNKMAIDAYKKLLDMYPGYFKSPLVESKIIKISSKNLSPDRINQKRIELFHKYNRKGKWATTQVSKENIDFADSVAANELYETAINYHQSALQKNDTSSYAKALASYRDYIKFYPASKLANECHYNLAEILFSSGEYYRAAQEYITVSKRYPDSKYKETAAWNAIVAAQSLIQGEEKKKQ